jgi:outer membrane protein OmpA-like peptidoglycan-associated protein
MHGRAAACLLAIGVGGCAVRQTVVLVPDPDGRVGEAEVATAGGTQILKRPNDLTRVRGSAPPAAVVSADPAFVASTFREALAVEPARPERFTLYFDTGTTTLEPGSRAAVPAIAAAVARRRAVSVAVSGHTDATGTDAFNDRLALARAERIQALLLEQGVAPGLLSVSSHGKANPAVPTRDGVAERRNRRVEVTVQ